MFGLIRSGMATAMHELSVVSNNIANAGSTAFKKSDVSFLICIQLQLHIRFHVQLLVKAQMFTLRELVMDKVALWIVVVH